MIKLAYCNIEKLDLNKGLNLVSKYRHDKISRYKFDKDKKLSCGAYLLLNTLLNEEGITKPKFKIKEYGKAYISNYDNISFNLSHCDKIVACGISDKEIGVDVEYNDPNIDLNIAKHYFFNEEYENIIKSKTPSDEFFKYWVLKESYMKYTGQGFHLKLNSFQIEIDKEIKLKNDNSVKFSLFNLEEYKLASAGKYKIKNYEKYLLNQLY